MRRTSAPAEEGERFESLDSALAPFSSLGALIARDREMAHYLAIHKLQYERLRRQSGLCIPQARFGMLRSARLRVLHRIEPVLFQERIPGTTLWDIFDFTALQVKARWQRHLPAISAQLSNLLDSRLLKHIDWNIQNFVFDERDERLFYVDLKPTTFVARSSNEHNLKGIREYFLA